MSRYVHKAAPVAAWTALGPARTPVPTPPPAVRYYEWRPGMKQRQQISVGVDIDPTGTIDTANPEQTGDQGGNGASDGISGSFGVTSVDPSGSSVAASADPSGSVGPSNGASGDASAGPSSKPPGAPSSLPPSSIPPSSTPPSSVPSSEPSSAPPSSIPSSLLSSEASSASSSSDSSFPLSSSSAQPISSSDSVTTPAPSPSITPTTTSSSSESFNATITRLITTTDAFGNPTTIASLIPTNLATDTANPGGSNIRRNAAIGAGIGALVILLGLLGAVAVFRRRKLRRRWVDDIFAAAKRGNRPLLASEFEDRGPPPGAVPLHSRSPSGMGMAYAPTSEPPSWTARPTDPFGTPTPPGTLPRGTSYTDSPPRLMRAGRSETGSVFNENVWPPPSDRSRLVDPLTAASSQVSLQDVVDNVMGPAPPSSYRDRRGHGRDGSGSSSGSGGMGAHERMASVTAEDVELLEGTSVMPKPNWLDRKIGRASGEETR